MADSGDYFTSMAILDANGRNVELYDGDDEAAEEALRYIVAVMNSTGTPMSEGGRLSGILKTLDTVIKNMGKSSCTCGSEQEDGCDYHDLVKAAAEIRTEATSPAEAATAIPGGKI